MLLAFQKSASTALNQRFSKLSPQNDFHFFIAIFYKHIIDLTSLRAPKMTLHVIQSQKLTLFAFKGELQLVCDRVLSLKSLLKSFFLQLACIRAQTKCSSAHQCAQYTESAVECFPPCNAFTLRLLLFVFRDNLLCFLPSLSPI